MLLSATKWATQIATTLVPRMSQKANPAVNALGRTATQLRMRLDHRVQRRLILPDQQLGAIVLVPIRAKREKLLDPDSKKARLSVRMRNVLCTPSSYRIEAKTSRGRTRFFLALSTRRDTAFGSTRTAHTAYPGILPCHLVFPSPRAIASRLQHGRAARFLSKQSLRVSLAEHGRVSLPERYRRQNEPSVIYRRVHKHVCGKQSCVLDITPGSGSSPTTNHYRI
jgi:hypothetical protein